ncbi:hypothetical protein HYN43_003000 [Mucilaginibacter celer]|uniref:Uncharacterized protein n=1 Tax=Mucilaginibacter celer TaxID=2305508 RepID=A0A494VJ87_9SPHI|nr:hypothetical protein HYN43_003000 [Mucilaginibacter celer]
MISPEPNLSFRISAWRSTSPEWVEKALGHKIVVYGIYLNGANGNVQLNTGPVCSIPSSLMFND